MRQLSFAEAVRGAEVDSSASEPQPVKTGGQQALPSSGVPKPLRGKELTFQTFVEGDHNRSTRAAAIWVAENPLEINPFVLEGVPGTGKTHLLRAIAAAHEAKGRKVLFFLAEELLNRFLGGIRSDQMHVFREQVRFADTLVIDDFQVIDGKRGKSEERNGGFQGELRWAFNQMMNQRGQIVVASSSPLNGLDIWPDLHDRLGHLPVTLRAPNPAERCHLVRQIAWQLFRLDLANEVAEFIARYATDGGVRVLEGWLTTAVAYAALLKRPLSGLIAQEALRGIINERTRRPIAEEILHWVAERFHLRESDVSKREHVLAAQALCWLCCQRARVSGSEVARLLGKNHSTVDYSAKKMQQLLDAKEEELTDKQRFAVQVVREIRDMYLT